MAVVTLQNTKLTVQVDSLGAQVVSVQDPTQTQRMWNGDPAIWGRHAPILFPIVGRLKNDTYRYQGQTYSMKQHGFARDQEFTVMTQEPTLLELGLTKKVGQEESNYPFSFSLYVGYQLVGDQIQVCYSLKNLSSHPMYFSIGGHPGFMFNYRAPGAKLVLQHPERLRRIDFTEDHLLDTNHTWVPKAMMPLNEDSFAHDAYVYHNRGRNAFELWANDNWQISLTTDAPYIGVWSAYPKTADFVCLEPWWGVADTVNSDGQLEHKFGINLLQPQQIFNASWSMRFYY